MDIEHHPADDHRARLHLREAAQRILQRSGEEIRYVKAKSRQGGTARTGRSGAGEGGGRRWRRTASIRRFAGSAMEGGQDSSEDGWQRLWMCGEQDHREGRRRIPAAIGGGARDAVNWGLRFGNVRASIHRPNPIHRLFKKKKNCAKYDRVHAATDPQLRRWPPARRAAAGPSRRGLLPLLLCCTLCLSAPAALPCLAPTCLPTCALQQAFPSRTPPQQSCRAALEEPVVGPSRSSMEPAQG